MSRARAFNWLTDIYYDVFHADKNHFCNCVLQPTIDIYIALGLADEFSLELGTSHSLGNLNVGQSADCIRAMNKEGHVRAAHGSITGGELRVLTSEMSIVSPAVGDITQTFTALMPLLRASQNTDLPTQTQTDTGKAFVVLHKLWSEFKIASVIRLTMSHGGDHSEKHQAAVVQFFGILKNEVNSELVNNLPHGLTYMKWPDHYVAEHLSDDMVSWAKKTGGVPFGRSSNQVAEHMNKRVKHLLEEHTNDQVSCTNKRNSKFFQVLRWLGLERFCSEKLQVEPFRKARACRYCTENGGRVEGPWYHSRKSSKLCSFRCTQTPLASVFDL